MPIRRESGVGLQEWRLSDADELLASGFTRDRVSKNIAFRSVIDHITTVARPIRWRFDGFVFTQLLLLPDHIQFAHIKISSALTVGAEDDLMSIGRPDRISIQCRVCG